MSEPIEVYEWPEGEPHPRDKTASMSGCCICALQVPPEGQMPMVEDVLSFPDPSTGESIRCRVLERQFLWVAGSRDGGNQPFGKFWLFVRRESGAPKVKSKITVDGRNFETDYVKITKEWGIYEPGAAHAHLGTIVDGMIANMDLHGDFDETRALIRRVAAAAGIPLNPPKK